MMDFLFDTPWWFLGMLAVVGAGVWMAGNKRRERRLMTGGLCGIGLAILLGILSYFVDTDKETVIKRSRELLAAVEKRDVPTISGLLHARATCVGFGKEQLVKAAQRVKEKESLRELKVDDVQVNPDGKVLVVKVTLSVKIDFNGAIFPHREVWEFRWVKAEGQWLVGEVVPIDVRFDVREGISRLIQ